MNCPKCQSQVIDSAATFCSNCGQDLAISNSTKIDDTDDLEFEVKETSSSGPEFVGGKKQFESEPDDLGIESAADLVEREAEYHSQNPSKDFSNGLSPIGQSEPPIPDFNHDQPTSSPAPVEPEKDDTNQNGSVKKLSDEEVKKIERNLYGANNSYLNDREKKDLISKLGPVAGKQSGNDKVSEKQAKGFNNTPIEPPHKPKGTKTEPVIEFSSKLPSPTMSSKGKGIAYYFRNYLHVPGTHNFLPNDEVIVNGREFELHPKKFDTKYGIGAAVLVFALILFAIGSGFVSDNSGDGYITGVVLDDLNQPYLQGAEIRLTESDQSYKSNPMGLFQTNPLAEGSHRIEYVIDGRIIRVDYATVVDGEITSIALKPDMELLSQTDEPEPTKPVEPPQKLASTTSSTPVATTSPPAKKTSKAATTKKKSSSQKSSQKPTSISKYGKVVLAANVDGARLKVDGSVLGAGNITYSKIKSGKHKYTISKDGYETYSGSFTLAGNETKKLKVNLTPVQSVEKSSASSEQDFYHAGINLLKAGEYEKAEENLTEAIKLKPSYAEAYYSRAESRAALTLTSSALDDYIQAAEIFQMKGKSSNAITSYNHAIEIDKNSITALLGRGNAYLSRSEERAAIADYESIIKIDKRNPNGYMGLGKARFQQGNFDKAAKHFKDAKSLQPNDPIVYQYLMLSYMGDNDHKKVKKSFDKFREVASENQFANFVGDNKNAAILEIVDKF